ncbi:MAG: FprA family A-type flavoprotein [Cytophagaceae bacterium]|jgi:flavorubredoxin|nr:FprA family A-type flavoprotein [Cytophagaceae bacterium]
MYIPVKLSENIFYAGVNDRRTALFENLMPLDKGVAYNSYLINDNLITLIDTVEVGQIDKFLKKIDAVLKGRKIDRLVINHMEPDHAGSVKIIAKLYPDIRLIGNKKTLEMINGYFGITNNLIEVKEGETLNTGHHTLQFFMTPMVHWPEAMVTYVQEEKILFSADAFGSFGTLDGGIFDDEMEFATFEDEMRRYYSNIAGKYGSPVQKALEKLSGLDIKMIASTHGPILRKHIPEVLNLYNRWSRYEAGEGVVIAYASMYGNTEEMAETVARKLAEEGVKAIRMYDVSKTHFSYIISDIFRYRSVILGSPTYNNELHPNMEALVTKLLHTGIKNRYIGVFGSCTWAGAAVKKLNEFASAINWEQVGIPVEEKQALKEEKYLACRELALAMAKRLKNC